MYHADKVEDGYGMLIMLLHNVVVGYRVYIGLKFHSLVFTSTPTAKAYWDIHKSSLFYIPSCKYYDPYVLQHLISVCKILCVAVRYEPPCVNLKKERFWP